MTPQPHRSRWTQEEDIFLRQSIVKQQPLETIRLTISLRTIGAIIKRAHELGYCSKHDKVTNRTYFHQGIKMKKRRTKKELMNREEDVPKDLKKSAGTHIKLPTDIIPKVEIDATDLDKIIAFHQAIIDPHLKIIEQLEKMKSRLWEH